MQGVSALRRPASELSSEYEPRFQPASLVRSDSPSGAAILKRNPFDSKTGALVERKPEPPKPPPPPHTDPLTAPSCDDISVSAIAEMEDPMSSLAVVRTAADSHGFPRRPGDVIGTRTLEYIGQNPLARTPAVWFSEGEDLCQVLLFAQDPRKPVSSPAETFSAPKEPPSGIQRVSDAEVLIDADAAQRIIKEYAKLTRGTKLVPAREEGRVVGLQLSGVHPESVLARLGLREGDQLESINGFSLSTPLGAVQAYAALRKATDLTVNLTRAGRALSMSFRIR